MIEPEIVNTAKEETRIIKEEDLGSRRSDLRNERADMTTERISRRNDRKRSESSGDEAHQSRLRKSNDEFSRRAPQPEPSDEEDEANEEVFWYMLVIRPSVCVYPLLLGSSTETIAFTAKSEISANRE